MFFNKQFRKLIKNLNGHESNIHRLHVEQA
jgi:hypothetical protein